MAKKATAKGGASKPKKASSKGKSVAVARTSRRGGGQERFDAGDAFVKLLQSPLVAELVAVAATAALATLAEKGFTSRDGGGTKGKRASQAVKAAGKAAAAAVGRRLGTEIEEIRAASKGVKSGAKA
jgi:hypothetical protein